MGTDDNSSECSHSDSDNDEKMKSSRRKGAKRAMDDDVSMIPLFPRKKKRMKSPWDSAFVQGNPLNAPFPSSFGPNFPPGISHPQFTPEFTNVMIAAAAKNLNKGEAHKMFGVPGLGFIPDGPNNNNEKSSAKLN